MLSSLADYAPNDDIFCDDDEKINRLKHIVAELDDTDRKIILMYAECGSQQAVADMLFVSVATVNRKINEIRNTIKSRL